ncbi:MAG: T9SS type A sorting domain-containing protein [Ignavibacteria bacterium]|nr:T9SS type A sorting domain-containing protein [Ignavibacteria bacterium]
MIVDIFGNVYTTGKTDSLDGTANYLTMKYDSSGNIKWIKKYGIGVYNEIPYCISLDNSSNIIVSGNNRITSNNSAIRTIKYSLISDIEFKNLIDNNDTHLSNYPNPFNSESIIKYKILNKGNAAIKIYDSKGGEMQILLKEYKLEGEYELKFDAKNYSSGVYYYSLILNNKILKTNRMLLIR